MKNFKPDLILISAGFDSRLGDPLGHFTQQMTTRSCTKNTQISLTNIAAKIVDKREGGYNVEVAGSKSHFN